MDKIKVLALVLILSILAGIVTVSSFSEKLRRESFDMTSQTVEQCPEDLAQEACLVMPRHNERASGGVYGFPIEEGRYYCSDDSLCYTLSSSKQARMINIFIVSVAYTLVFGVVLFTIQMLPKQRHN